MVGAGTKNNRLYFGTDPFPGSGIGHHIEQDTQKATHRFEAN